MLCVLCTLYLVHSTCTYSDVRCTMYLVPCTMYDVRCTMYLVLVRTMYYVLVLLCTRYDVPCTMHLPNKYDVQGSSTHQQVGLDVGRDRSTSLAHSPTHSLTACLCSMYICTGSSSYTPHFDWPEASARLRSTRACGLR